MKRIMLKSKIQRPTLTATELMYEGSITVDQDLMEQADILAGEQVHVFNVNNGARLVTYAIPAARGSGTIMLNGPAARLGTVGDKLVILSFCELDETELPAYQPRLIMVDDRNRLLQK
ncbi:MAG: aspartate 1-decarboxylase [Candidatus Zixiibacteriota bacterium]|nr:MAG: aspartate 1-decarboxylase [candidate division Zixibacteria bacterium]